MAPWANLRSPTHDLPAMRGHPLAMRSSRGQVGGVDLGEAPLGQSFLLDRAIAPMAGATASHKPMVTTIEVM